MKQTARYPATDEISNQQTLSGSDQQTLETAKRDILKSLNITSQDPSEHGQIESADKDLGERVEVSLESIRVTQDKVSRLSGILNAVSSGMVSEPVPVREAGEVQPKNPFHMGDLVVNAALSGDLNEPPASSKELTEPVQVSDSTVPGDAPIVIAGEIVGGTSCKDAGNGSTSNESHRQEGRVSHGSPNTSRTTAKSVTGTADQAAHVANPSKRQLAVSFPKK